jgi:hypothetical protein
MTWTAFVDACRQRRLDRRANWTPEDAACWQAVWIFGPTWAATMVVAGFVRPLWLGMVLCCVVTLWLAVWGLRRADAAERSHQQVDPVGPRGRCGVEAETGASETGE